MGASDREALRTQLIRHEGVRLAAYQDSEGFWTIGVGRMIDARRGGGITRAEADYLLAGDIDRTVKALLEHLPWALELDGVRLSVLVNMAFNMGVAGLLTFRNTLKAVQQDRYDDAAAHMLESKWAEQVGSRAVELAEQMRSGRWAV